jgi:uncharacterized protein (DUF58 family)
MTEWKAMIPSAAEARARASRRFGFAFGYRFFLLLFLGLGWLAPAFVNSRFIYAMLLWDALLVLAWATDLFALPRADQLRFRRLWSSPLAFSVPSEAAIGVDNDSNSTLYLYLWDALPWSLRQTPPQLQITVRAHASAEKSYSIAPAKRGSSTAGTIYLRYEGAFRLAQRWASAELTQALTVYPNLHQAKQHAVYLVRSRQIMMEKRFSRIRGSGKSFESLREYREGDDINDICWTATARRGKLVTRLYELEKSQSVWLVLDTGRLMRTRVGNASKLDHAVNAALTLGQVALLTGDRVGLIAYGRTIQQRLPAQRGSMHLRQLVETLALVQEQESEADHLRAASQLMLIQKRRSLVVWISELAETSMTPEVIEAASKLLPRHLVVFALIGQPDLHRLASRRPENAAEMYEVSAAQEIVHRREMLLSRLRERGALAVEVEFTELTSLLVNSYLDIKQKYRL